MRECTMGDKRIAILMAVYNPRRDWLIEQLKSLNSQTYGNIMLYICDDCSPNVPFEKIEKCVRENITAFPYEITRNETNLGSNLTFQRLTEKAQGDYLAYCDQDDIWLPEKLEVLKNTLEQNGAELVCSDMYIIDGNGKQVADSITKVRRNHVFRSGEGLAGALLIHNFVTGCTMLVRAETAKASVPFCAYMVHDNYIAVFAAEKGAISSVERPLVRYRIHGENQTGVLKNSDTKASYISERIDIFANRMKEISVRFPKINRVEEITEWALERQNYAAHKKGSFVRLWGLRGINPKTTLFELLTLRLPNAFFGVAVRVVKRIIEVH